MNTPLAILLAQSLSLIACILFAIWYVLPWRESRSRTEALRYRDFDGFWTRGIGTTSTAHPATRGLKCDLPSSPLTNSALGPR